MSHLAWLSMQLCIVGGWNIVLCIRMKIKPFSVFFSVSSLIVWGFSIFGILLYPPLGVPFPV